jgi:hypothetical protein
LNATRRPSRSRLGSLDWRRLRNSQLIRQLYTILTIGLTAHSSRPSIIPQSFASSLQLPTSNLTAQLAFKTRNSLEILSCSVRSAGRRLAYPISFRRINHPTLSSDVTCSIRIIARNHHHTTSNTFELRASTRSLIRHL